MAAPGPRRKLAALGSCLGARIHANAQAGSGAGTFLELDVGMDVGAGPRWEPSGAGPPSPGFDRIRTGGHIGADASQDAVRVVVAHAVMWSPLANTLHDPVHLDVGVRFAP